MHFATVFFLFTKQFQLTMSLCISFSCWSMQMESHLYWDYIDLILANWNQFNEDLIMELLYLKNKQANTQPTIKEKQIRSCNKRKANVTMNIKMISTQKKSQILVWTIYTSHTELNKCFPCACTKKLQNEKKQWLRQILNNKYVRKLLYKSATIRIKYLVFLFMFNLRNTFTEYQSNVRIIVFLINKKFAEMLFEYFPINFNILTNSDILWIILVLSAFLFITEPFFW